MPINIYPLICIDFETTGLDKHNDLPIEIGAIACDPRTLEPYPGETFESLMGQTKESLDALNQTKLSKALDVNKKTREEIIGAPSEKVVWNEFAAWCGKFSAKTRDKYQAPIFLGFNLANYDRYFVDRLATKYGQVDKSGDCYMYNRVMIDLFPIMHTYFESLKDPSRLSLDFLRDYFGIPKEGAHGALVDCQHTLWIYTKFQRMQRNLMEIKTKKGEIKGAYRADENI